MNFGSLYGQGAMGLVGSAWAQFGIELTEVAARTYIERFKGRYPTLVRHQRDVASLAEQTGVLRSVCGRPLRAAWEPYGLKWTQCCNYPVQSSAADVVMLAMVKANAALGKYDAQLLLQIHDELLVETAEDRADEVKDVLLRAMVEAWTELFPVATTLDLVDAAIRPCWAKPKTGVV